MLSTSGQSDSLSTQQNASSLQQPRDDLQQTTDSTSQSSQTSTPQSQPAVTQDQLKIDNLRVGSSNQLIPNTTSTSHSLYYHYNYFNAAWLWLFVPLVLAVLLFWPTKKVEPAATQVGDSEAESVASKLTPDTPAIVVPRKDKKKRTKSKKK